MSSTKKIVSARELLDRLEAEPESPPSELVTPKRLANQGRTTSRPSISDWLKNVSPSSNCDYVEDLPPKKVFSSYLESRECKERDDLAKRFASASSPRSARDDEPKSGEDDDPEPNIADDDDFDWTKGDLWPKLTRTPFISKEEPLILSSSPEVAVPAHIGKEQLFGRSWTIF